MKDQSDNSWSIRKLLVLPGILITIALSASFLAAISYYSYQNLRQDFDVQFENIGSLFSESITDTVLLGQDEAVYRSCNLLKLQQAVNFIEVVRNNGTVVCNVGSSEVSGIWTKLTTRQILFNPQGGEVAANVKIQFSLANLRKELLGWLLFGLILAVVFALANGALYFKLANLVADPISRISAVASAGDVEKIAAELGATKSSVAEVGHLSMALSGMASKIISFQKQLLKRERDRVVADYARQIAHDIRSPLSALQIMKSKMVSSGTLGPESELMGAAIQRIEEMAGDMLKRSQKLPQPTALSVIHSALERVCGTLRFKAESHQLELIFSSVLGAETAGSMSDLKVYCNLAELERVVGNLIENAFAASKPGDVVTCELSLIEGFLSIAVIDRGAGISSELLQTLGKQEVTSTKPSGNGLGVYHASSTVESWGGSLSISSELGSGSRFILMLPLEGWV